MPFFVIPTNEWFWAKWTFERFFPGVNSLMTVLMYLLRKCFCTVLTFIWLLHCMSPIVLGQTSRVCKVFWTKLTFIAYRVSLLYEISHEQSLLKNQQKPCYNIDIWRAFHLSVAFCVFLTLRSWRISLDKMYICMASALCVLLHG